MLPEPPIACTLAEAERPARRAEMAAIARDLVSADAQAAHAVLRLRPADGTRERVAAFVAAESRCCALLRMRLSDAPGVLTLTIDGPAGSEAVVEEMVAALTGVAVRRRRGRAGC